MFDDFLEDEIVSIAKRYMRMMVSHRFHSGDHLRQTLQTGVLKLLTGEIVTTPGESEETDYIRFLAARSDILALRITHPFDKADQEVAHKQNGQSQDPE